MANKTAAAVVIGLGTVAGIIFLATKAKAAEPEPEKALLTVEQVLTSSNMGELEVYYMYMGQLYLTGQIDRERYESLYQAYVDRFYQLIGGNQ